MNTNKLMQDFEKQFKEELQKVEFPSEAKRPLYFDYKGIAVASKSIMKLGCDVETYAKIIQPQGAGKEMDLYAISFVINAIEQSSPFELDLQTNEYLELIKQTREMASKWNELVEPIKKRVSDSLQPKPATSMKGNMKVIPKKGR